MHDIRTATVRFRHLILIMCLLLVFLNGCAGKKRVTPPPAQPTASKPSATVPSSTVKPRPVAAKPPPAANRPVVNRPAVEDGSGLTRLPVESRPVVTKPPVEERSAVMAPPIEEHPLVTKPPVEEQAVVAKPPEERPPATESPVKEGPAVTGPPVEEAPVAAEPPAEYKPVTGRAAGIYNEAEQALQAGRFSSAEMLLERALRIEPRNAHYWYILGLAKFRQKQYPQAVQFCLKAESLAGSQPDLMARNQVLLAQAKKAAGMK